MKHSDTDLNDFINVLVSYRPQIESNTKPHPYLEDRTVSYIALEEENQKFHTLLFPERDTQLLGVTEDNNDSIYKNIYDRINSKLPGLGITFIDAWERRPLTLMIEMKSKEDSKGGKKKRSRKRRKSTKKRHIKKKNYTKKRR